MIFSAFLLFSPGSSAFQSVLVSRRPSLSVHRASQYDEFEYLLRETNDAPPISHSRRQMKVSLGSEKAICVSSVPAPTAEETIQVQDDGYNLEDSEALAGADETFGGSDRIMEYQETRVVSGLENRLKGMDFQDTVLTLIVPSILLFAAGRWTFNRVSAKVKRKVDKTVDSFAQEMIYHDGDFEEMRLCATDYNKKLVYLGPLKRDRMVKRYLQEYAKRKTVSPQAISSLSYAFSVFALDEESAASLLVALCREMGKERLASVGKLFFLSSRILKTPQGKKALEPIRDLIMSTYRDASSAGTLFEISQQAIAETAYKTTVLAGGKNQSSLTPGWEVLGLKKEVAQRIWDDAAKEGFKTDREAMYGGHTTKYDKDGNRVDDKGNLLDPDNAIKKGAADESVDGVFECGKCGFTLFVAAGRESKFYGSTFKCPECGAPKSEFSARDTSED